MSVAIGCNLNDYILVKLLPAGVQHWYDWRIALMGEKYVKLNPIKIPAADENGWTKFQLWEFAMIFGERLHQGAPKVCEMGIKIRVAM